MNVLISTQTNTKGRLCRSPDRSLFSALLFVTLSDELRVPKSSGTPRCTPSIQGICWAPPRFFIPAPWPGNSRRQYAGEISVLTLFAVSQGYCPLLSVM